MGDGRTAGGILQAAMNFLLIHQNFPGQFKHLTPALVNRGHRVVAMPMKAQPSSVWQGVELRPYMPRRGSTPGIHPWAVDFETKTIRAEACFRAALALQQEGFDPDVILAHPGWGESLFLKDVWPKARLGIYCEFHYLNEGADSNFDPEFVRHDPGDRCRLRLKNLNNLLHFDLADAGLSPTLWQASTFPEPFRSRITVAHDGIDTERVRPNPSAKVQYELPDGRTIRLDRQCEVVTFVNRNLEPYRGYHIFMRALPALLKERPQAQVVIVGGDQVSYGAAPDPAVQGEKTWREVFIKEVRGLISDADWARVHFVGQLPYDAFISLLQVSTVHVYLTYPFVLSWSLLEAMSIGCAIAASDTAPLREAIEHDVTGRLVDFFSPVGLVQEVNALLDDPSARQRLGARAREFAQAHYDLHRVCLPQQLAWAESLGS
jgi:glycosyltransferase involved in cell wall biosynthesis